MRQTAVGVVAIIVGSSVGRVVVVSADQSVVVVLDRRSSHQHKRLVRGKEEEEGELEREQCQGDCGWSWYDTATPYYIPEGE